MSDDGFHTHEEFEKLYGPEFARKQLVILLQRDGEFYWSKYPGGWYRLEKVERDG